MKNCFQNLLTTNAQLPHLLYSDVVALNTKLAQEFPEIITLGSIGTTWHNQQIQLLTLDARQYMKNKLQKGNATAAAEKPQAKSLLETIDDTNMIQLGSSQSVVAHGLNKNLKKTLLAQMSSRSHG